MNNQIPCGNDAIEEDGSDFILSEPGDVNNELLSGKILLERMGQIQELTGKRMGRIQRMRMTKV